MNTQECASKEHAGRRNRFFRGKRMKAGEFQLEQEYGILRRRLLTRAIAGWGIVQGLRIDGPHAEPKSDKPPAAAELKVTRGLGIDRRGREAVVAAPIALGVKNTFVLADGASGCQLQTIETIEPGGYVLAIHYAERPFGEVPPPDDCGCEEPQKAFLCETVVFSLRKMCDERCECGEPECRACGCACSQCAEEGRLRGIACLCQWSEDLPEDDEGPCCKWNGYVLHPADRIDLACVRIESVGDKCNPTLSGWVIDEGSPRRFVKTNDALYDLIRGCDLTRIDSLSWGRWHRLPDPVGFDDFLEMLTGDQGDQDVVTKLAVTFSGPVRSHTLTADCFEFTFDVTDEDTGWLQRRVVPITRVVADDPAAGDPDGTTRKGTICVDYGWYQEITSRANKFTREGGTASIEVYGDFILDCNGQAVDANARGFALYDRGDGSEVAPSGNGTPGGTLLSVFRIEPRPYGGKPPGYDKAKAQ